MINLNFYNSYYEAYIHKDYTLECDFKDLVELLKDKSHLLSNKKHAKMFNCCKFKDDYESPEWVKDRLAPITDYIRRCKENVESISCLLLDVDGTKTLEQTIGEWADYEFLAYSTHGNSKFKDKFRLVIPLKTPLSARDFDERHDAMCNTFGVDNASITMSQAFYVPSYSTDNKDIAFIYHNEIGNRYDAMNLDVIKINTNRLEITEADLKPNALTNSLVKTLMTGSNLHYNDALPLATMCKSNGIDCSTYIAIVNKIASHDSILKTDGVDLQKLYSKGYQTNMTSKKTKDIMSRLNCDLWRWEIHNFK